MLYSTKSSSGRTAFGILLLFILPLIYSPPVSAQETQQPIFPAESHSENLPIEPETLLVEPLVEDFRADEARNAVQTGGGEDYMRLANYLVRDFHAADERAKENPFNALPAASRKSPSFQLPTAAANFSDDLKRSQSDDDKANVTPDESFRWRPAIGQSLMFLAVQHGYALAFQQRTRDALKGKFFKDYINSVKDLHGWDDGNRFFTNYIAHPMQGALTGFIYIQNNPKEMRLEFGDRNYWKSRLKAFAWSSAWSTQFEIGPISQSSIGNVGLKGKLAWGDLVVTPTVGTGLLITEDWLDRSVMKRIERRTGNFYIKIFARMLLNPTRNFANILRFREPWYRDRPPAR